VLEAREHPNADKLYVLKIDTGGGEQRQLCAGLRSHYTPEQLVGRLIVVVANLAPRALRGEISQGMLLAAGSADKSQVIFLTPERDIAPGAKVT
jgi:methionyl-tRNA synthetase